MPNQIVRNKLIPIAWLLTAASLIGASIGLAARANADGVIDAAEESYILAYGATAVCPVIDAYPSAAGVMGVMQGIMNDGFSADNSVDIINASVWEYCPRHWQLLEAIGEAERGESAGVKIA